MVCWWISTTVEAAVAVEVAKEACQEYNVAASLGKRKGIQGIASVCAALSKHTVVATNYFKSVCACTRSILYCTHQCGVKLPRLLRCERAKLCPVQE